MLKPQLEEDMKCPACDGNELSCEECGGLGEVEEQKPRHVEETPAREKVMLPILPINHDPL